MPDGACFGNKEQGLLGVKSHLSQCHNHCLKGSLAHQDPNIVSHFGFGLHNIQTSYQLHKRIKYIIAKSYRYARAFKPTSGANWEVEVAERTIRDTSRA